MPPCATPIPPWRNPAQQDPVSDSGFDRFLMLVESVELGVVVLEPAGDVCYANPAAERLLARRWYEIEGRMFGEPLVPVDACRINSIDESGTLRHLEMHIAESEWSGERGYVVTLKDVSDVHQLAVEAEARLHSRDAFLATLSHELRNPLSAVTTGIELMRRVRENETEFLEASAVVGDQLDHVRRMLDDLLDSARLLYGKLDLQTRPIDLRGPIRKACAAIRSVMEERGHVFEVGIPGETVPVNGDSARLQQILSNLLTNAAKYTPAYGTVRLSVQLVRPSDGLDEPHALLTVSDNGVGFEQSEVHKLFEPFLQEQRSTGQSEGGLGLGLSVARTLVERHGGSITADSDGPGKGSRFTVRLPLCPADRVVEAEPAGRANGDGLKILIVEDVFSLRQLAQRLIRHMGHTVVAAADGFEALDLLAEQTFDIALIDIGMPKMDGYEVVRRAQNLPHRHAMQLVALTGYGRVSDRGAALAAGFDGHLTKPFDVRQFEELIDRVRRLKARPVRS